MGTEDSELSQYFRVRSDTTDESGSTNLFLNQPRDINYSEENGEWLIFSDPSGRSGSSAHLETHPDVTVSIERNDYFDINPGVVDGSGDHNNLDVHSSITETGSNGHMIIHPDNPFYHSDLLFPTKKSRSSSSSSSSVSSEDLFQVDTKRLSKSRFGTTFALEDECSTQPALKDEKNDFSSNNTSHSSELQNASPSSTSTCQVSQVTCELPTQTPPIQVMDRSGQYDPLRIPASVFDGNKSTTPLDWSVASNESLFSIQLGNNSFSRDQVLMLGSELFKSGELTKSSELLMFSPSSPVPEMESSSLVPEMESSSPVPEIESSPPVSMETDKKSVNLEKGGAIGESDEIIKDTTRATAESQSKEKPPSAEVKSHARSISDESVTSSRSFAFPIKKKKKKKCAWPSCYGSNCSCTSCYCTWPSCYFRWPSCYCSNCSLAFCYGWNCSKKRWCCHSSTHCSKNVSVKVVAEKPQQQPLTPEVPSKSIGCNWFCCCSSRPSCCHFRCRPCCC